MKCWICGASADSREHLVKASDVRSRFGKASASKPLFIHSRERKNERVLGLKSNKMKSNAPICAKCNNEITQPYDVAWEKLSAYLCSRRQPLRYGDKINLKKVFPGSVRASMKDVQLFFVKGFGFKIVEGNAPIDIRPFSEALLQRQAHPSLHIAICDPFDMPTEVLGQSELYATNDRQTGRSISATWIYHLDCVSVFALWSVKPLKQMSTPGAWHPNNVTHSLKIGRSNFPNSEP